jgi:prophage regulatory protein
MNKPAVLKLPAVLAITQLSRSSVYRLEAAGEFPKRIQLAASGHAVGWYQHEIEEYLASRPRVAATKPA